MLVGKLRFVARNPAPGEPDKTNAIYRSDRRINRRGKRQRPNVGNHSQILTRQNDVTVGYLTRPIIIGRLINIERNGRRVGDHLSNQFNVGIVNLHVAIGIAHNLNGKVIGTDPI